MKEPWREIVFVRMAIVLNRGAVVLNWGELADFFVKSGGKFGELVKKILYLRKSFCKWILCPHISPVFVALSGAASGHFIANLINPHV